MDYFADRGVGFFFVTDPPAHFNQITLEFMSEAFPQV